MNRLLVLDDDPFVPRWIRKVAEREGYAVSICQDVQTVRTVLRSVQPTLIVMDLTVGGGGSYAGHQGLEALRLLAAERCTAPVILTGAADPGVLQSASRFGMTLDLSMAGIMPKPIELALLRETLTAHLHDDTAAGASAVDVDRRVGASASTGAGASGSATIAGIAGTAASRAANAADEARLRDAFEQGELRVYYQPQISLRTGAVAAIEALVRWQHPLRGLISPNSFLPIAEQADLMRPITCFVIATALDACHGWRHAGEPVSVSVNLAPSLLHDPSFPDAVEAIVRKAGVPPASLTLEINERAAIGQAHDVLDALTQLRLKGCRLSVDNFGTASSSLVELRNLPFSQIKIDKASIGEARAGGAARGIVESVIEFGHRIALEIVGEGVEDRETLAMLKDAGCDLAQGFLISHPVDAVTLGDLLSMPSPSAPRIRAAGSR